MGNVNEKSYSKPWNVKSYTCVKCGKEFSEHKMYTCDVCGLEGILEINFDYEKIKSKKDLINKSDYSLWRYSNFLPIDDLSKKSYLHAGWTPLYELPRLASKVGVAKLWVKDDGRNPTNSFKDRASAIGAVKAQEYGQKIVAAASTGNAAASLAGACAALGLRAVIFVPEYAPDPKIAQLLVYGASVFKVKGSYANATKMCNEVCEKFGWYNRNAAVNPYLVEGKKTGGLELAEQMADNIPDWVSISVGDGCTIAGIWKGIEEMYKVGVIKKLPKLLGVQAIKASPITKAFNENKELIPSEANTIADSINVGEPANWIKAVNAMKASKGKMINVSDEEIILAIKELGSDAGVFAEPAASASYAGVKLAVKEGMIKPNETVAAFITGNGLKDIKSAMKAAGEAFLVDKSEIDFVLTKVGK